MTDAFYPTIPIAVLCGILSSSNKVHSTFTHGSTTCYIVNGNAPIGKRMVIIRADLAGEVDYEFAVGTATKLKVLSELLDWYEKNKNWKEGAYFVANN